MPWFKWTITLNKSKISVFLCFFRTIPCQTLDIQFFTCWGVVVGLPKKISRKTPKLRRYDWMILEIGWYSYSWRNKKTQTPSKTVCHIGSDTSIHLITFFGGGLWCDFPVPLFFGTKFFAEVPIITVWGVCDWWGTNKYKSPITSTT